MSITANELLRGCEAEFAGEDCSVSASGDSTVVNVGANGDATSTSDGLKASGSTAGDVEISSITYNSANVETGRAFFCIEGFTVDGHKFAPDAVRHGASLIVAMHDVDLEAESNSNMPVVAIVKDTRRAMALAAANFYGNPSEDFKLVGVTGTNGKTTTTYILDHILTSIGSNCGIIGTTGNRVGSVMEEAHNTTPESIDLQHLFARMRDAGDSAVVMEVSSHALELYRPFGSKFAVTAFTNLTQDHLDFHKTFEDYFNAKAKLFSTDYPARRVVCLDDEWGVRLAQMCEDAGDNVLTCGFSEDADIHPVSVEYGNEKTHVVLNVCARNVEGDIGLSGVRYSEGHDMRTERVNDDKTESANENNCVTLEVEYPLVGKFNVSNMMCAFGVALQLGIDVQDIVRALRDLPKVPGRLERFSEAGCANVFVDYAHTPDAIEKAIASIKELKPARTVCVFGCGGDRDAKKRPLMGRAALAADFAVVTSDNPRTEDPLAIIEDILPGMDDADSHYKVIPDRAEAIKFAIDMAGEGDAVLIAGKGHEDYQIIGTKKIHFDDREVVQDVLREKAKSTN